MKALVKTGKGPGNIQVKDISQPSLHDDDWVVIKVHCGGVCGTDIHIWKDEFPYWPPVTLGHEFSGEVVEVGGKVTTVAVGDRVVAEPHSLACGTCYLCRQGHVQLCSNKRSPGWGIDGCFAEYVTLPAWLLHKIPDNLAYDVAALAEPLAIVIHHVAERGSINCQDTVVVTGTGIMGLLSVFVAQVMGAGEILITGLSKSQKYRFPAATALGASKAINIEKEQLIPIVNELTHGRGADLVVETSGAESAISQAIEITRKRGTITGIGLTKESNISVPWNRAMHKSIEIRFNMSSSFTGWESSINLLNRYSAKLGKLITRRTSIEDWEQVFVDLIDEKDIKALFVFE